ncbi:hypothetical protein B0T10DRAFT_220970 [Thelonectria olida]|uniref:Uncharacterized protein n=1 Tax=Thelonectria olida TaxID=1576542 RepID=A0A9P8WEE5_9HYPO|nr:hypothetical protein B0T10DRAFT_220970 [Thelonectria olida]
MLFRVAATTLALLAANVVADSQPYKLVTGPVLGISLARRDTYGYQPEQSVCGGSGTTCAEVCGSGYEACGSNDGNTHCFNPADNQSCCGDGSGNSCDEGYYCTHDTKMNTWCCPDDLNLVQCAAKFKVDGELETSVPTTSSAKPTSTVAAYTTNAVPTSKITKIQSTTTPVSTSTPKAVSHTSVTSVTSESDVVKTEVHDKTTTVCPTPLSAGHTTAWTGSNSTASITAAATQPYETPTAVGTSATAVPTVPTSAGAVSGASVLLLAVAGVMALL